MVLNGPKWSKMVQNSSKWFKMVQNSPNFLKKILCSTDVNRRHGSNPNIPYANLITFFYYPDLPNWVNTNLKNFLWFSSFWQKESQNGPKFRSKLVKNVKKSSIFFKKLPLESSVDSVELASNRIRIKSRSDTLFETYSKIHFSLWGKKWMRLP